ncbi:O-methyltransferase [Streptoalloteichus tenebrarius]|uniref:O-methyltransferase n=1 Tax=Streptoalloteichus tenebrarius (strain ATCC 17920 / DSM 40477 / JCM 4838 / CBS 697.72 / NBRC 16177 / NCIMB 11028 / NRRL B-12390 / A12253. 1 / ISP 5477) TaxID=1933 RepID=A0ABT1HTN8_STRSD|nr:methyltransferase [Streptoalloteichus tenebrarius]MCP2258880.1 O-methyltransferase [Streptoalloteichus tenebrarius]BFE99436.1 methyltransferase [Streptoalloteichus tenebrarius]
MTKPGAAPADARQTVLDWMKGSTALHVLGAVTRMSLADAIGDGEADVGDLARAYDIPEDRMLRFLRALADLGLCAERGPGRFALTEVGSLLRTGRPGSMRDHVRLITDPMTQRPWSRLESCLRGDRTAFEHVFDMPIFAYLARNPELSTTYNAVMGQLTEQVAASMFDHYDFDRFATVTDVGGGNGSLLTAILRRHPHLRGVLFDSATGAAQAGDRMTAAGVSERCSIVTGDFFRSVPSGSDLYLLKWILHDWDDERAALILRRCREAMTPHSTLLIIDRVLPDQSAPGVPRDPDLSDLTMMVLYGGRERGRADFERLCASTGLSVTDVVPLPPHIGVSLVEAVPVRAAGDPCPVEETTVHSAGA